MAAAVRSLDLMEAGPLGREALRPEDAVSPAQQRLYQLIGRRVLDAGYRVGGACAWNACVFWKECQHPT
jgi:hypothetical protein